MEDVKVKGQPITIDGATYILPPLPLKRMPDVALLMQGGNPMQDPAYIETLINAIWWSLKRNYPTLEITVIEDGFDMTNYEDILKAFMLANKFTKASESGEVPATQ